MGALITLFWTSDDVCLGFKNQSRSHHLHASCSRILIFISGVTPTDLLVASVAAEPLWSTYLWTSIGRARVRDLSQCVSYAGLLLERIMILLKTVMVCGFHGLQQWLNGRPHLNISQICITSLCLFPSAYRWKNIWCFPKTYGGDRQIFWTSGKFTILLASTGVYVLIKSFYFQRKSV